MFVDSLRGYFTYRPRPIWPVSVFVQRLRIPQMTLFCAVLCFMPGLWGLEPPSTRIN
jgi:hypothetical protein